ncbi:MAG: hypothetical protein K9M57_05180, partial [Phycisphaerae bacterium]|nr:hypothetical protein [Phycisphaerae bacterium]
MKNILEILKKNVFWILCGVVFLVSMGLFVSAMLNASENQKKFDEIKKQYDEAQRLEGEVVSNIELQLLESNANKASMDYKAAMALAMKTSSRPLLHERVFPSAPPASSALYYQEFAQSYCDSIKEMMLFLNGGDRPSSQEEMKKQEEYTKNASTTGRGAGGGYDMGMGGMMPGM